VRARLFLTLLLLAPSLGLLGCGDDAPERIGTTEVRIFVKKGLVQTVEANTGCPDIGAEDDEDRVRLGISPELIIPEQGNVEVWILYADLPPGPCTVAVRGRDDEGEVICGTEQTFTVDGPLTEVAIILDCDTSPG